MMRWLTTLPAHNYITDPEDETGDKSINKDLCAAAKNTYVNFEFSRDLPKCRVP